MAKLSSDSIFPDYTVSTQFEDETTIRRIAGGKQLMLVVLRYIGCPSCRYDVHMLQEHYEGFVEKGFRLRLSCSPPQNPSVQRFRMSR